MIEGDDNSLIGIAMVAFVLCANAGGGNCKQNNVGIQS